MDILLKKSLKKLIDNFYYNVLEYGCLNINSAKNKYKYHFTIFNGAFKNETKDFSFEYFRELTQDELDKFVMKCMCEFETNYKWNGAKFKKILICY